MPFNVGPMELVIVLAIALMVLGPKRLPDAGKAVGRGLREFRGAISGDVSDDEHEASTRHVPAGQTDQRTSAKAALGTHPDPNP